jgi:hypothetical protein
MVMTIAIVDFCEYCAKDRDTALVRMGRFFVWMCVPCQFRYAVKKLLAKVF